MKTYSNIKPDMIKVNKLGNGQAEVLITLNIVEVDNEQEGFKGYEYDLYIFTVPYRENLEQSIVDNLDAWVEYAKKKNEPVYTPEQITEQRFTDIELNDIMQGQQITDLELMILEG